MGPARATAKSAPPPVPAPHAQAPGRGESPAALQAAGNQQVLRALGGRAKLSVSQPDAPEEREADRMAEAFVARKPLAPACSDCDGDDQPLMRKADGARPATAPPATLTHGSGEPLAPAIRGDYEGFLGADLSSVRVHTDPEAQSAARAFSAQAFTVGSDVYFGSGRFAPGSAEGRQLLAHELAHTVQSGGSRGDVVRRQICEEPDSAVCEPVEAHVILPDYLTPLAGQMTQSEFLDLARAELNAIGDAQLGPVEAGQAGLGDMYVDGIEYQALVLGKSIEQLVSETVQQSLPTAQEYLSALLAAVPDAVDRNREAIEAMIAAAPEAEEASDAGPVAGVRDLDAGMPSDVSGTPDAGVPTDAGVGLPAGIPEPDGPQTVEELQDLFPEISPTLAGALVPISGSIWGPLRVLLQGQIFHAIISAGYLFGNPPPAHPLALVNRGGGVLGRRRTDLRDPATGAVIEIKPVGQVGGTAQLAAYIATLGPPWHAALNIPSEAWAPQSAPARYTLNPFGINVTLVAWNNFAAEPGMLYYELQTTPGVPVYVPVWSPRPERRFDFRFPRITLPEFELPVIPAPTPQEQAVVVGTTGMILLLIAATLIPVVPPPP